MRTTLTLDDDVAALLRQAMKRNGTTLKEQLNRALRAGLTLKAAAPKRRRLTRSHDAGRVLLHTVSTTELLALGEGETYR